MIMDPKEWRKYEKKLGIWRREVEKMLPNQRIVVGKSSRWFWAAYPLGSGNNLQKTASKSLLEMLQNTPKLSKKNCFYTEIFYIQKSENENFIFDLSMILKSWNRYGNGCSK